MSLIWEQLRDSEEFMRPTPARPSWAGLEDLDLFAPQTTERRRSGRADTYVPLFVYGYTCGREPFHEDTNSLEVSNNGGLLRLDAAVRGGQKLLLHNKVSNQEMECTVVRVERHLKRTYIGVSFAEGDSGFWQCRREPDRQAQIKRI